MTPETPYRYSYRYSCSTSDNSADVNYYVNCLPMPPACCLAACCLLPAACCLLPAACCLLPPASCLLRLLPPAHCLLPTASCPLPPAPCLLPIAYQRPAYTAYILPIHCLAILPTSTTYCIYCRLPIRLLLPILPTYTTLSTAAYCL